MLNIRRQSHKVKRAVVTEIKFPRIMKANERVRKGEYRNSELNKSRKGSGAYEGVILNRGIREGLPN